ncbi:MAG TPA: transposase [Patescibacteria group bacterium]|nr:transposase [Patescibacteria group bacterium]
MTTSKSPLAIALVSYASARATLPLYYSKFSRYTFTLPQLMICLVLKEFFKTDYRGISAILSDSSDLQRVLELRTIPHFTTLQKAAHKLLSTSRFKKILRGILTLARKQKLLSPTIAIAALDGTGFESHHISRYFVHRTHVTGAQTTHYTRFPKVGIITSLTHLILSAVPERGPRFDSTHFVPALQRLIAVVKIKTLLADAGYDSEPNHRLARDSYHIRSIIPAKKGRPTQKLPTGKYRRLMTTHFPKKLYGQRWQVETVNSMLKRNLESFLRARSYWSQCREILLRVLTHNIMIVRVG